MKKHFVCFCCAVLLGAGLTGCSDGGSKKLRIGVSVPAADHGWTGGVVYHANRTARALEKKHPDLEIILSTAASPAEQVTRLENLAARKIDALVVMTQVPGPITPVCERIAQSGVYVVAVSNKLAKPCYDYFISGDNASFGRESARAMASGLGGRGDIVVMEGMPCTINTERVEAFRKALAKYPKIRILESRAADWDTEKGLKLMENYLQKYPRLDGVWAGDDDVLLGALKALEESKRSDVRVMLGGGGSKAIVKKVLDRDRVVHATVTYPPEMISAGIEVAAAALRNGKKMPDGSRERAIFSQIVTPENAAEFYHPGSAY